MVTDLALDRMALDDVGANPVRIAEAIHAQMGKPSGPVPVEDIAKALDIVEVRVEPLQNIEGALLTDSQRDKGSILLNLNSGRRRRRFTLGHELLHFLNALHVPTDANGFWCSRGDMTESDRDSRDRHVRQEAEANAFAIELLAPRSLTKRYCAEGPDLTAALLMSDDLDISKEAAARRYVACHDDTLAVIFSRDGRFTYADRSSGFPFLSFAKGAPLPELPPTLNEEGLSRIEEADTEDWHLPDDGSQLMVQTLHQRAGYATTLLRLIPSDDEDDPDIEDTYERFSRF